MWNGIFVIIFLEPPENWTHICKELFLPNNFDVWYYFFQNLFTVRSKDLISKKINDIVLEVQKYVDEIVKNDALDNNGDDLKAFTWTEEANDVGRLENAHKGVKTLITFYLWFSKLFFCRTFYEDKRFF